MNYIRHLNAVFQKFAEDVQIVPRHISLYMALFQLWNRVKFADKISLSRSESMSLAKIGSVNTYIRTLKELHARGYICYHPSHNPLCGSSVTIITFDTSTGYTSDITTDNTLFINRYINNNKQLKTVRENAPEEQKVDLKLQTEKSDATISKKRFIKPSLEEIKVYFQERKADITEADRFFNHFESNGWKVGGKSPMKDWKAAVRNWILNIERYNPKRNNYRDENYLSAPNVKNYEEPL